MNYRTLILATAVAALATSANASYVANIGVIPPFGPQQWNCASNSYTNINERFILQFIDATHIVWNRNGTVDTFPISRFSTFQKTVNDTQWISLPVTAEWTNANHTTFSVMSDGGFKLGIYRNGNPLQITCQFVGFVTY
jgi:hypothetical protein